MNKKTTGILALVIFLAFAGVGWAKRPVTVKVGGGDARVSLLEGSAELMPAGTTEWKLLNVDALLKGGDQVKTGDQSRIELILPDSSRLRFAGNTRFQITSIDVAKGMERRNVKVHLVLGRTWANVTQTLGVKSGFELTSENAVAGVRGTVYRMNVNDDQSALVRVYDGEVAVSGGGEVPSEKGPPSPIYTTPHKVEGPKPVPGPRKVSMEEWVYIVKSMQQIRVGADGVAEPPRAFTETEDRDPWVDWNKERDAVPIQQ
jgi:ferric-dicitrate binding protein FerR (iron transport regulator)